jgi:hypothetical protein
MLLLYSLTGHDNVMLKNSRGGLGLALKKVAKLGGLDLARLTADCLRTNPGLRPQNYEVVLRRLKSISIPTDSLRIWRDLRAPYVKKLASLGLGAS